jgi:tRNA pseudouridine38-40 synthase
LRYFFHIAYHGFRYRGWQRQQDIPSVQEVIEDAFERILKEKTTVYGCGRTDAKVSASQYFFHIDTMKSWDYDLVFRLNKVLPEDIAVFEILPVQNDQHARYDASSRTYDYFIHFYKDPFLSQVSSMYQLENLDLEKMKAAVALLTRYENYYTFCKSPDKHNHTLCTITDAQLFHDGKGDRLRFSITANRFLKCMIRMLMGKILEIGKGESSVDEFEHCLRTQEAPKLLLPAHPQGLYLSRVKYPFLDIEPRTEFSLAIANRQVEWKAI